jgi:hypothetical protein
LAAQQLVKLRCTGRGKAQTVPSFKIDAGTKLLISVIESVSHVAEAETEDDVKVELVDANEVVLDSWAVMISIKKYR